MRRRRTSEQREAICKAHKWQCGLCPGVIDPVREKWALDHIVPLAGGGSDTDDNLQPVHEKCHLAKTVQDVSRIAKGKRIRSKHIGAKERNPRGFRGWRKFNGDIVWRAK